MAVLAAVGVVAAGLWWWGRPSGDETRSYTCSTFFVVGDQKAEERGEQLCARQGADSFRRTAKPDRSGWDSDAQRIAYAVRDAVCPPDERGGCLVERPANATDIDVVRAALTAAGHPEAVVRLAGSRDPAPDETVVYGVYLAGDAVAPERCLVSYVVAGRGDTHDEILGMLPGGKCLDD